MKKRMMSLLLAAVLLSSAVKSPAFASRKYRGRESGCPYGPERNFGE